MNKKVPSYNENGLFELNPVPTLICDVETLKIYDCNQAAIEYYKYAKEVFLERTFNDLFYVEDAKEQFVIDKTLTSLVANIDFGVFIHKKKNGARFPIQINGHIIDYKGKKCVMLVCQEHILNIQKQNMLQEAKNLLDTSLDVICSIDENGKFIRVSAASFKHWGYTPEELEGRPYLELVFHEDVEKTNFAANQIISGKDVTTFENRYVNKNGEIAYNIWSAHYDNSTRIMYAVARDATEKREMEQLLIESESRFKSLVQEGLDLIAILDDNGNYSYVSPSSLTVLGINAEELIGKSPFEFIHPDDVEKVSKSLERIATERRIKVAPFRFQNSLGEWRWIKTILTNMQHHPSINGIVANSRDITEKIEEQNRLKLLESVILNTKDSVVITEAESHDESGPKILYVNEAFTKMTGYAADEVIGKTPHFLHGPNSDKNELSRLSQSLQKWESCEITIINYKKNGEEFWNNFMVNPVVNEKGVYTHWVAIQRDVTEKKNHELEQNLLHQISQIFNEEKKLKKATQRLCETFAHFGAFDFVEVWYPNLENTSIQLHSYSNNSRAGTEFYTQSETYNSLRFGEGFIGAIWQLKESVIIDLNNSDTVFIRKEAAINAGIKSIIGIPLVFKEMIVGVLVFGSSKNVNQLRNYLNIFRQLETFIGSEINRKSLETNLKHLFQAIPDIICITDFRGRFLKINKAGCSLLGYSKKEILYHSFHEFVLPEDQEISTNEIMKLKKGETVFKFENRYLTKKGEIIWLSWTCNSESHEGHIYASAKNITKEKKLSELQIQTSSLAKIGSWEIDLFENKLLWTDLVHALHETDPKTFKPDLETTINFYREDFREMITESAKRCATDGTPFSFEAVIKTMKNNERWVRVIGQSEFVDGNCVRIFGSFQDIHPFKLVQLQLEEILGSISDAFYAVDQNWNFTYFNKEAENLFLKKLDDVLGKNIWNVFSSIKKTPLEEVFHRVNQSGIPESFEYFFQNYGRWYEINTFPSHGGISVYFKDIDERKKTGAQLEKAYQEKNNIIESITDAFFTMNKSFIVSYWNRTAEVISGMNRAELVGKNLWEVFPNLTESIAYTHLLKTVELEQSVTFEDCCHGVWLEVNAYPSEEGITVFFRDITEKKQAEEQILKANERFEKVTQATNDVIWDWDIEHGTFFRSHGIENFFDENTSASLPEDSVWRDKFHAEDFPLIQQSLEEAIQNPAISRWEMEYRIIKENRKIGFVVDKGLIIRNKKGKATRIVGAMTDISERKKHETEFLKLNESLKKHTQELEATNELLEQFAFIASHDLQEPLRMVTSFLDLLKQKYESQLDQKAKQYIHFATDGAIRMKQIILDLLEYSRAGITNKTLEEIDLNDILYDYKLLRSKIICEKKVTIQTGKLPELMTYKVPLVQTMHCLIDNAIKYSKKDTDPVIKISVEENNQMYVVSIKDNGIGIDKQYYEKIFIIFQRLHNKNEYDGTGIGLALSKKNVESWGGTIWINSAINKGTTVHFTIPKREIAEE